jgi:HEAT repeat protein
MHARFASGSERPSAGLVVRLGRLLVLFLPVTLLLAVSVRAAGEASTILWMGTLFQALACGLALWTSAAGREPAGPAVIMLYVIALSWLLLGGPGREDWLVHLSQATLLVVPLGFFAVQCLIDSGATAVRRARQLAARLAARRDWPADLMECRLLPEVKALREALHLDASPALQLLVNPRPAVRIAALAALEFRPTWRPGQPQVVLQLARKAPEPEVRAAALYALGNVDDRVLIESLAELLRDPSALVRQTANEALLWNTEQRWHWIRDALRHALSDPVGQNDGQLKLAGNQLTAEAVGDLHAWAAEKGIVAWRAALTLGAYYSQLLADGNTPELSERLRRFLADPHTPPMLRLELARLMHQHHELDADDLRRLLDPSMPAPVRLIAAEALLSEGPSPEALAALHDLARLPNREIALSTAEVVQRRLGVDLGLPRNQPLPAVHSRTAAEVARRVLSWATQHDVAESPVPVAREAQPAYRQTPPSSRVDL